MKNILRLIVFFCLINNIEAQIIIKNQSFEDIPKDSGTPIFWEQIGIGSTPDVLPGFWMVKKKAVDGKTYIGLIHRENGTSEAIVQKLSTPIIKNTCYTFSIFAAQSKTYAGYNKGNGRLQVIGFSDYELSFLEKKYNPFPKKYEILAESEFIDYKFWKELKFKFTSTEDLNYLVLKISMGDELKKGIKSNILLDKMTNIEQCIQKL